MNRYSNRKDLLKHDPYEEMREAEKSQWMISGLTLFFVSEQTNNTTRKLLHIHITGPLSNRNFPREI
tara:strand:- start:557 stop:757 length:201 start_codon:yes stop_codon:yes gene_type:complete